MVKYIFICNMCGKRIVKQEEAEDHPNMYYSGRYGFHDMENFNIDFCFDCFDKLISNCKVSPLTSCHNEYDCASDLFADNGDSCEEPDPSACQDW